MPLVREAFRPTLREELARRSPAFRRAAAAVIALVVVGLLVWALRPEEHGVRFVHEPEPTFNLRFGHGFERAAPRDGELLRIRRRRHGRVVDSFAVRRLRLPPYRGDVNGILPVYAEQVLDELRRAHPGLELVEEGKARVNLVAGYSLLFRVGQGRDRMFGREVLLPEPEPGARTGVRMSLRTWRGSGVGTARALGTRGKLRIPYRSFRYGTEAP